MSFWDWCARIPWFAQSNFALDLRRPTLQIAPQSPASCCAEQIGSQHIPESRWTTSVLESIAVSFDCNPN